MGKGNFVAALLATFLAGCSSSDYNDSEEYSDTSEYGSDGFAPYSDYEAVAEEEEREPFDEDAAREAAEEEIAGENYTGIGSPYGCTDDCSGHEAGFRYRAENGYQGFNADSPSFNEGGQAFDDAVEERVEEMQSDYEAGEDPDY